MVIVVTTEKSKAVGVFCAGITGRKRGKMQLLELTREEGGMGIYSLTASFHDFEWEHVQEYKVDHATTNTGEYVINKVQYCL